MISNKKPRKATLARDKLYGCFVKVLLFFLGCIIMGNWYSTPMTHGNKLHRNTSENPLLVLIFSWNLLMTKRNHLTSPLLFQTCWNMRHLQTHFYTFMVRPYVTGSGLNWHWLSLFLRASLSQSSTLLSGQEQPELKPKPKPSGSDDSSSSEEDDQKLDLSSTTM